MHHFRTIPSRPRARPPYPHRRCIEKRTMLVLFNKPFNVLCQFTEGLVEQEGDQKHIQDVIDQTSQWLDAHPDDGHIRYFYAGLVVRKGDAEQVRNSIGQIARWLEDLPDDTHVRVAYLSLV